MRSHLQRDHYLRSRQIDRSYVLATHMCQSRKRVLAERALACNASIATLLGLTQRSIRLALALDPISIARFAQSAFTRRLRVATIGARNLDTRKPAKRMKPPLSGLVSKP